jgi:hypothetical protein
MVPLQPDDSDETSILWPRARNMPLCSICSDLMVAPEVSALQPGGKVVYLWCCDICGDGFVSQASILRHIARSRHKG